MDRAQSRDLIGKIVVTKEGTALGDVLDIEVDLARWTVSWVRLRLHRALTDRFHIDAPLVMGTKVVSIAPRHVLSVDTKVSLGITLEEAVLAAVVSYDTDATNHLGNQD